MAIKQTSILFHGYKIAGPRNSTRLFGRTKKPARTAKTTRKKHDDAPLLHLVQRLLADLMLSPSPPPTPIHGSTAARSATPTFFPPADWDTPFLCVHDSFERYMATYPGYVRCRDDPPAIPQLPADLWTDIAILSGDGKRMRRLATLGRGFADAARLHEDNTSA